MIWLTPAHVTIDDSPLHNVDAVIVEQVADELVSEHGDAGPHVIFADVTKLTTRVRIIRKHHPEKPFDPAPGAQHTLAFRTAPNASDTRARTVTATIVITGTTTDHRARNPTTETISAIAISPDGKTPPITHS